MSIMTEQKQSTDAVETKHPQQPETAPHKPKRYGWVGNTLSIAITLAIGAGAVYLYHHGKQQNAVLTAENLALQHQVASLAQQQSGDKQDFATQFQKLESDLQQAKLQNKQTDSRMVELQTRISEISNTDLENWRLAQANYLVKMAGRKIWTEQDTTTAIALLKDADQSLAEMDDPSLLHVRQAIMEDINTLSKINQLDLDGIILTLNRLSNQIDNLRLEDNGEQEAPMDEGDAGISASLSDWRKNLSKSWDSFMENFITIKRRDSSAVPLLAPNQDVYLRENIRSRLLVAAQAVPRHQNEVYKQSLEAVSSWVRSYFDTASPDTKTFLQDIDSLAQKPLSIELPEHLSSQPILADLMRKRIYNLPHQSDTQVQPQSEVQPQPKPAETSGQAETPVQEG
ncbi:uroporphyrinogen-III C-methyltransferase [Xenorhabdus bovienii]|nr:uroporphyrinogen-III C-methyltransferase [Xenorhabdus bovienii]MDE9553904.1 uroporphyrinogen-III C-methyltransferase [Xenorhabdus bovienii]